MPYEAHLAAKAERVWASLAQHVTGARCQIIASPARAFRHKCGFGVWRQRPGTGPVGYALVDPTTGGKVRVASHFAASEDIQVLMHRLLVPLNDLTAAARDARRGLCTFTFYSTLHQSGAAADAAGSVALPERRGHTAQPALVALGYNRPLGEGWRTDWAEPAAAAIGATVVGRGPAQERRVAGDGAGDGAELVQWFEVGGRRYPQHRRDGIFVQCNAAVCAEMLRWMQATLPPGKLLLEPYCGNGNATLPLAASFARVLASDVAPLAVSAAAACAPLGHAP